MDDTSPSATPAGAAAAPPLRVTVLNGNLSFVAQPLMVGHTRSQRLTGTEAVVDRLVGGAMQASLDAGLYPEAPGTHQVFVNPRRDPDNPWRAPRPSAVIVVGLGEEGRLGEEALARSARQAVLAWVQRCSDEARAAAREGEAAVPQGLSLAATLMGSGGMGMHAGNAARAIALGVRAANERLASIAAVRGGAAACVGQLVLVELYLERAADAWHGLQVLAAAAPGRYAVDPAIAEGVGPLRRQIETGYRGADHDLISATAPGGDVVEFRLDTRRARTEVRAQSTQGALLRELVARASTDRASDARLGRTLFQLLVPPEIEPFLAGNGRVLLELDQGTAAIPWEMLDSAPDAAGDEGEPWAIRTQLVRKLRSERYRLVPRDAGVDDAVLVIGEPATDPRRWPRLPAARQEALTVRDTLRAAGIADERLRALVDHDDAAEVLNALFEQPWRIVHVAGHGEPPQRARDGRVRRPGGVVLSGEVRLGADEIRSMRSVPELVFINCCHLAAHAPASALRRRVDRVAFASALADALIDQGVRCVVAAGWAVADEPARAFAARFYEALTAGEPFAAAVAAARRAARERDPASNTWAAYQCYGDPDWRLRGGGGAAAPDPAPRYAGIASASGLQFALEELAVQSRWMHAAPAAQQAALLHLEQRFGADWGRRGAIAEAFASAWAEAGEPVRAIEWYARALACPDGSASLKAQEQWAWQRSRLATARATAAVPGDAAFAAAVDEQRAAVTELQRLAEAQPTAERLALVGSACKRLAELQTRAGDHAAARGWLRASATAYGHADAADDGPDFYPGLNRLALQWLLGDPLDDALCDRVRAALLQRAQQAPDFWCWVGQVDLDLLLSLARGRLAADAADLQARYAELHRRVASTRLWRSVADQVAVLAASQAAAALPADERQALERLAAALRAHAGIGG